MINRLRELLFPTTCIGCGTLGKRICLNCEKNVAIIDFPICVVCDNLSISGSTHKACKAMYYPDSCTIPFEYKGIIRKIIINSKHGQKSFKLLNDAFNTETNLKLIRETNFCSDYIIPMPQTNGKHRLINHAEFLACSLSTVTNVPILPILKKDKSARSQKELDRNLRKLLIRGTMYTTNPDLIKNKKLILVDDVSTTGSSLIEASIVLKMAGASHVDCYALAKDFRYNNHSHKNEIF